MAFSRRQNLEWHVAAKKTVTAYHRDRLSANYRFVYSRRFTILQIAQTIPKAEFTVAFSHRRNLKRHIAAVTDLSYCPLLCVTPPFRYSANNSDNFKGGTVSGDPPLRGGVCLLCRHSLYHGTPRRWWAASM